MGDHQTESATEHFERLLSRGFVIAKIVAYGSLLISYLTSWRRIPRPAVAGVAVGFAGIETAVSVARVVRRRQVIDPVNGHAEVMVATSMILGEALSWGSRAFPPDPRLGLPHAVSVGALLPAMIPDRGRALWAVAVPTVAFIASSSSRTVADPNRTRPSLRVAETCVLPLTMILSHRLMSELRLRASQQDEARAQAIDVAERVSSERERQRQYRHLHDSALQVLETIAGGWDVDDLTTVARIDQEISLLESELAGSDRVLGRFDQEVMSLAETFTDSGLTVDVEVERVGEEEWMGVQDQDAFVGGIREALNNVIKHSGVREANVRIIEHGDRVSVTVSDRGEGFDPGQVSSGFGLSGSIIARMNEVGGGARVRSEFGKGTEVELWLTRS